MNRKFFVVTALGLSFNFINAPTARANPAAGAVVGAAAVQQVMANVRKALEDATASLRNVGQLAPDLQAAVCSMAGRPQSAQQLLAVKNEVDTKAIPTIQQTPCGGFGPEEVAEYIAVADRLKQQLQPSLASRITCRPDVVNYLGALAQLRTSLITLRGVVRGRCAGQPPQQPQPQAQPQ